MCQLLWQNRFYMGKYEAETIWFTENQLYNAERPPRRRRREGQVVATWLGQLTRMAVRMCNKKLADTAHKY
jgi:hypothetical protein